MTTNVDSIIGTVVATGVVFKMFGLLPNKKRKKSKKSKR